MNAHRGLCGLVGALFSLAGVAFVLGFLRSVAPGGAPPDIMPLGPGGVYFVAFTGCALVGWGGGLIGAARQPGSGRTVGTATATALFLMALYRIAAWFMGDYAFLDDVLRVEAAIFLLLALCFLWLRPPHAQEA